MTDPYLSMKSNSQGGRMPQVPHDHPGDYAQHLLHSVGWLPGHHTAAQYLAALSDV